MYVSEFLLVNSDVEVDAPVMETEEGTLVVQAQFAMCRLDKLADGAGYWPHWFSF